MIELYAKVIGEVQGVGFRGQIRRYAVEKHLRGSVQNLEDGSVEMVLQGEKDPLEQLLDLIQERFEIERIDLEWKEVEKPFFSFEVL